MSAKTAKDELQKSIADMEIEKTQKSEVAVKEEKRKRQHRRGGIRTLPFILGQFLFID